MISVCLMSLYKKKPSYLLHGTIRHIWHRWNVTCNSLFYICYYITLYCNLIFNYEYGNCHMNFDPT